MKDIHSFLERYADDLFHIPYLLAQDAIGETDGGLASHFECDFSNYGSGFANAGGFFVAETLLRYFPADEIIDRVSAMKAPEIRKRFEDSQLLTAASIPEIADDVTRLWHGALQKAFPEISGHIGDFSPTTARAVTKYLKFQHACTVESGYAPGADSPSAG
jgi:hypothetical protein